MSELRELSRSITERQKEHERVVDHRRAIGMQRAAAAAADQRKGASADTLPDSDVDETEEFVENPEEERDVLQYLNGAFTDESVEQEEEKEDVESTLARELRRWQKSKRTEQDEVSRFGVTQIKWLAMSNALFLPRIAHDRSRIHC